MVGKAVPLAGCCGAECRRDCGKHTQATYRLVGNRLLPLPARRGAANRIHTFNDSDHLVRTIAWSEIEIGTKSNRDHQRDVC
jgi:hypothetical protein